MSSTWNHRVMKHKDGDQDWFQIHEVYYKGDNVDGYTENGISVGGRTIVDFNLNIKRKMF